MKLLDASAIFNLFINGKFNVILSSATIPLAKSEIGNVIWKNYKVRNRISKKEAKDAGMVLSDLIDSMEQINQVPVSTLTIELEKNLTLYDSSYLTSAMNAGYHLVTDDIGLEKTAGVLAHTEKSHEIYQSYPGA